MNREQLSEIVREAMKQNGASPARSAGGVSTAHEVRRKVPPPADDADIGDWIDWVRRAVHSLSDRSTTGAIQPSTIANILRENGSKHPTVAGPLLQDLLRLALAGTRWCVCTEIKGGFNRVFLRDAVPNGFRVLDDYELAEGGVRVVSGGEAATLGQYRRALAKNNPPVRFPNVLIAPLEVASQWQGRRVAARDLISDLTNNCECSVSDATNVLWLLANVGLADLEPDHGAMPDRSIMVRAPGADEAVAEILRASREILEQRFGSVDEEHFDACLPEDVRHLHSEGAPVAADRANGGSAIGGTSLSER